MFFKKALQRGARYKPNGLIQGSWKYEYDWPKPRACFSGQPKCLLSFSSSWVMICIEGAEKNLKFIYSFCYLDYISYFVFVLLFFFLTFGAAVCHNSSFKLITAWTTVITSAKCWFGRRNVLLSLGRLLVLFKRQPVPSAICPACPQFPPAPLSLSLTITL